MGNHKRRSVAEHRSRRPQRKRDTTCGQYNNHNKWSCCTGGSVKDLDLLARYDYFGRLVDADAINFEVVRSWMCRCARDHEICRMFDKGIYPRNFRVIDCDTLHVVLWESLPGGQDYFTLSYVWSQAEDHKSTDGNQDFQAKLSTSSLPQVILDAVEVTGKLRWKGSRYLWVDRYCIDNLTPATNTTR